MAKRKKSNRAKNYLRIKTSGGRNPKFTESDPLLGGVLGQLTGQGYVTRKPDEPHIYMITGKGVQWINPDEKLIRD